MRLCRGFAALALLLIASRGRTQEILLTGPLAPPTPSYWVGAVPAQLEWSYWTAGGLVRTRAERTSRIGGSVGLGAEWTLEVLRYHGFPSGYYGRKKGDAELRAGPWMYGATRSAGGLLEGGLKLHLGGIYHASFSTWDLRLGAGYGAFEKGRTPHASATLGMGVRSALGRYPPHRREVYRDTPAKPSLLGEASVARVVVTLRQAFDAERSREWVLGVELSPTFLLPPYGLMRFAGGPPWPI